MSSSDSNVPNHLASVNPTIFSKMSGFRNVMKDGWHPKGKEGAKESWRGDFKGINQVVKLSLSGLDH